MNNNNINDKLDYKKILNEIYSLVWEDYRINKYKLIDAYINSVKLEKDEYILELEKSILDKFDEEIEFIILEKFVGEWEIDYIITIFLYAVIDNTNIYLEKKLENNYKLHKEKELENNKKIYILQEFKDNSNFLNDIDMKKEKVSFRNFFSTLKELKEIIYILNVVNDTRDINSKKYIENIHNSGNDVLVNKHIKEDKLEEHVKYLNLNKNNELYECKKINKNEQRFFYHGTSIQNAREAVSEGFRANLNDIGQAEYNKVFFSKYIYYAMSYGYFRASKEYITFECDLNKQNTYMWKNNEETKDKKLEYAIWGNIDNTVIKHIYLCKDDTILREITKEELMDIGEE